MKKLFIAAACMLLVACNSKKELSKDEAQSLIEKDLQQKGPLGHAIYMADEEFVTKLRDTKVVRDGYITFISGLTVFDIGKPLIRFEDRAKPYLLPSRPGQDSTLQRVKIGGVKILKVNVKMNPEGTAAQADYTYRIINLTPFAELTPNRDDQSSVAYFSLESDGWQLTDKADPSLRR
jgi:hypothetical protein